jgi:hypothetical protein
MPNNRINDLEGLTIPVKSRATWANPAKTSASTEILDVVSAMTIVGRTIKGFSKMVFIAGCGMKTSRKAEDSFQERQVMRNESTVVFFMMMMMMIVFVSGNCEFL